MVKLTRDRRDWDVLADSVCLSHCWRWGLYSLLYYPQKLVELACKYSGKWCLLLWLRDDDAAAIINYKLKSVVSICSIICISKHAEKLSVQAHLPWRAFMYKAFNTFIDDAFAWLVEMPTKHRIMTLRDDLVFFIYLYQRYLYPVDKKRTNEFGRAYESEHVDGSEVDASTAHKPPREIAANLSRNQHSQDSHNSAAHSSKAHGLSSENSEDSTIATKSLRKRK